MYVPSYLPTYFHYISPSARLMNTILRRLEIQGRVPLQTKPRDPFITWSGDQVTNEKSYISTSTRPIATKLDKEVASDEKILSTKLHNLLIMWTHQVT